MLFYLYVNCKLYEVDFTKSRQYLELTLLYVLQSFKVLLQVKRIL